MSPFYRKEVPRWEATCDLEDMKCSSLTRPWRGMAAVPFLCFTIALIAAFSDSGYSLMPALFALGAILTAPLAWIILRRNITSVF